MSSQDYLSWWPFADDEEPPQPSAPPLPMFRPPGQGFELGPTPPLAITQTEDPLAAAALREAVQQFVSADYLTATYDLNARGMAELYDAVVVPQWSRPFAEVLLSQLLVLPRPADARVLDVACGTGFPTLDVARMLGQGVQILGLDTWRTAIERAQRKATEAWLRNVAFQQGDIAHSTLPEGVFDLITCNLAYTSFADRSRALAVMTRLLRPTGSLILTTPLQTAFREFLDLYHLVLTDLQLTTSVDALLAMVRGRPTIATTVATIERTGLHVTRQVADRFTIRFADTHDFLTSPVVALGFMVSWRAIVPDVSLRRLVFNEVERRLNARSAAEGGLSFEVPYLCLCAQKSA
jgi:arsenite methyltransferase